MKNRFMAAALVALASVDGTAATSVEGESEHDAVDRQTIDELVVTARKTEENLQKVPVSVTAIRSKDIDDRDIGSIEDISTLVPNLMVRESASGYVSAVSCMRGLCRANTAISEDPMVGTYVDGIYVSKAIGSQFEAGDLERVEVLRGPQGTLFGKNTLGGAINLVTKKPTGEFGGYIGFTGGNYGKRDFRGAVDFPVTDDLAARVSLLSKQHDGYTRNTLGSDLWSEDKTSGRAALRWSPGEDWVVDYAYDKVRHRDVPGGSQIAYISAPNFDANGDLKDGLFDLLYSAAGQDLTAHRSTSRLDRRAVRGPNEKNLDVDAHTLTVALEIGPALVLDDVVLKSISGYRDQRTAYANNLTPFIFSSIGGQIDLETLSQELQLQFSALDNGLQGIIGAHFFTEDGTEYEAINYDQVWEQAREFDAETESSAIFGELRFAVSDRVELSAGFRYTREERSADSFLTFYDDTPHMSPGVLHDPRIRQFGGQVAVDTQSQTYFGIPLPGLGLPAYDRSVRFSSFSPRLSISYDVSGEIMLFASYARGFKSGGFNGLASSPVSWKPYDDVVLDSYEFGVKSRFWDGRGLLNISAFYEDVSDMQVQVARINPLTSTYESVTENAASATVMGVELEAVVSPYSGFTVSANLGYQDPKYDDYLALDTATGVTLDVSDSRVFEFTPKFTYSLTARYEYPVESLGVWVVRMDMIGMSSHDFQSIHHPLIDQDAYRTMDAMMALEEIGCGAGELAISAWVKNITDRSYAVSGFNFPDPYGFGQLGFGHPRTYGLEVTYNF